MGVKLLTLGNIVNKRLDFSVLAEPHVRCLSRSIDEMISYVDNTISDYRILSSVIEKIAYVNQEESEENFAIVAPIGSHDPGLTVIRINNERKIQKHSRQDRTDRRDPRY